MVCWATVATMMASWRDQQSHTVDSYIASLGDPWAAKLAGNQDLSPAEAPAFLATAGLQVESTQMNFTSERWESMLRDYGPLWVTADTNAAPGVQGVHAHILVGIHGPSDGVPTVDVIDPGSGSELQLTMTDLVSRYEQLAGTSFAGLQVRHWPAGAQRSAQASLAWARQASVRMSRASGGPAAVAVAELGWSVIKEIVNAPNGLSWNRATMNGTRVPGDDQAKRDLANGPFQRRALTSKKTLTYDFVVVSDHVGAEFEVAYQFNGHSVANVKITNTSYAPPGPLSGRNVQVETDIYPALDYETADVAAVTVDLVYHFSNSGGSQGTYVDRIVVFGDGRPEVRSMTGPR